jgi:hypothetical protein
MGLPFLTCTQPDTLTSDTLQRFAPKVHFTCGICPVEYIKEQMPYFNYVRDRHQADVHIVGTTEMTGSGGHEGTLVFIGQGVFAGMTDTLTFHTHPDHTEQERRDMILRTFTLGMIRYVARTPLKARFDITYTAPANPAAVIDRWKSWVFDISAYGYFSGQEAYASTTGGISLSANKVTADWKFESELSAYYSESLYDIGGVEIVGISRSQYGSVDAIRSISDHWSIGLFGSATASSYSNLELGLRFAPAVEYNVLPYSQSTRKQLRVSYRPGFESNTYTDTTIYNKLHEDLWMQSLGVAFKMTQEWGSLSASATGSNYLHDFSKNSLDLYVSASVSIMTGLSLSFGGGYSFVHDQLSLPKAGATDEELLLRLKQIATTYSYYSSFGITYTFGSIYNTVVNPRFGT